MENWDQIFAEFRENLGKLRRNEEQMTEEQLVQYAPALEKLREKIWIHGKRIMDEFIFGSMHFLKADAAEEEPEVRKQAVKYYDESEADIEGARAILFRTYSEDDLLTAVCPLQNKVWFLAYGPYWAKHSIWDDERQTWRNEVCDAVWGHSFWWSKEHHQWESEDPVSCTIMLPPTIEMINEAYRKEVKQYGEWTKRQNDKKR